MVGTYIAFPAFTSTSKDIKNALNFSSNILLVIKVNNENDY